LDNFGAKFVVFCFVDTKREPLTQVTKSMVSRLLMVLNKMKYLRLIPALLLGALLTACNTPKKLYEAQQYDQVIQRLAPDICDGDMNAKRINLVAASYHKANQADHERIQALKATGQPDVWPEIYQRYCSMKGRNQTLKCFPAKVKNGMKYVPLDLDEDMMVARNKAESFLVAKINQLLTSGSKPDAEEAGKYIDQLRHTNRNHAQLMDLEKKQLLYLADKVDFGFQSDYELPNGFEELVFTFDADELPSGVAQVCVPRNPKHPFAYVVIDEVKISPIRLDEVTFKETNSAKSVDVTDHSQNKSVTVSGSLFYYLKAGSQPSHSVPFEVTSTFKNDYTTIKGDREACSAETLNRLNTKPVPVPTDESMLLDAAKQLNNLIATELKK